MLSSDSDQPSAMFMPVRDQLGQKRKAPSSTTGKSITPQSCCWRPSHQAARLHVLLHATVDMKQQHHAGLHITCDCLRHLLAVLAVKGGVPAPGLESGEHGPNLEAQPVPASQNPDADAADHIPGPSTPIRGDADGAQLNVGQLLNIILECMMQYVHCDVGQDEISAFQVAPSSAALSHMVY